jgi:hypothetical protein
MAIDKKDNKTLDWLEEKEFEVANLPTSKDKHKTEFSTKSTEEIEINTNEKQKNLETASLSEIQIDIEEEIALKTKKDIIIEKQKNNNPLLNNSINENKKTYNNIDDFIGTESYSNRYVFINQDNIFSIDKDFIDSSEIQLGESLFKTIKAEYEQYKIFSQTTEDFISFSDNQRVADKYFKSCSLKKEHVDPDKLLESIKEASIDAEEEIEEEFKVKKTKKTKKRNKKI